MEVDLFKQEQMKLSFLFKPLKMKPQKNSLFISVFLFCLTTILYNPASCLCQNWSADKITLLPDSSFALIEIDQGKKIRHCPHHLADGKLDAEQLIYALGTFNNEIWIDRINRETARKHLLQHYDRFITENEKKGSPASVNINQSPMSKLVSLPQIGPFQN